jgi:outer membrane receptor protein involved in Fe transport
VGTNIRKNTISSIRASTNGGLSVPGVYALSNSKNALIAPSESFSQLEVDGVFGKVGLIYDSWIILDATARRDVFSTLPKANNAYYYPAASLGLIFTEKLAKNDLVTFGKVRFNYAEVGNGAPVLSLYDTYTLQSAFNGQTVASNATDKNNPDLKPERTKSIEAGLEMRFLKDRVGFDVTVYKMNTVDQILLASVSRATGYNNKFINAGDVENKGLEIALFVRPVHTQNFDWRMEVNWAANRNKVLDLNGIDNLQLASMQGGVSINAALNEAYGTIRGSDYIYLDGKRVVGTNGRYKTTTTSNNIIGNINPDWTAGVTNSFRYKNVNFSFLIDTRQGGDLFSLDMYYGLATGLPEETAGLNDLGNELRAPLGDGGGVILDGVKEDGSPNDIRVSAEQFGLFGYRRNPAAGFVYDASFIKLREVNLNINLPAKWFASSDVFKGANFGVYGRNLWIIKKNMPYADPEDGLSSGNVQGYQTGSYPTARIFGANLNVKF